MKRSLLFVVLVIGALTFASCGGKGDSGESSSSNDSSVTTYTPSINVPQDVIELTVGDKLELMKGVSATGFNNEDVTDQLEVIHSIPVDDNECVTTAGDYDVTYRLVLNEQSFEESIEVVVSAALPPVSITNGDFETGSMDPFTKSDFEGGGSTVEVVDDGTGNHLLKLTINAVSYNQAAPRLEYTGLGLQEGKVYEISFDARADADRTMHMQVGELVIPAAEPWYMEAYDETYYFPITTTMKTYSWRIQPSSNYAGADLTNLSILFEFGTMTNGGPSPATIVYLDNISIEEVDALLPDTTAPIIIPQTQEYFYVGDYFHVLSYVKATDEKGGEPVVTVVEEESTMPPIDDDNKLLEAGNYSIKYKASDEYGNSSYYTYEFEVKIAAPVVDNFNLIDFLPGTMSDITDTIYGRVYSQGDKATFDYTDGVLTLSTTQSKTEDDWTATQVYVRSVRVEGTARYCVSFDINTNVDGYIQVADQWDAQYAYKITKGDNHIAFEKTMFDYNYTDLTIVLGTHKSLQQPGENMGPCEVKISNFSCVNSNDTPDTIAPAIKLNSIKTYFVGDTFDLMSTVYITDNRDSGSALTLEVDESKSTLPPVDENNLLTTAGEYAVTFVGSDSSGNSTEFVAYYLVREPLANYDGFNIERVEYGEEWELDDPSTVFLWHDSNVNVTSEVIDTNSFRFTSDQTSEAPWYATQLFFKSLKVDTFGLYTLSYDIVSDVAGTIKLDGAAFELQVGTNHYEKTVPLTKGSFYQASIQFGKEEIGVIGPCEVEIRDLSLVYIPQAENPVWEGYGMSVTQEGTDNIITYSNIPNPWYDANARIYDFTCTKDVEVLVIEFTGTKDQSYQFKYEGIPSSVSVTASVTATGERQTVLLDMRNYTDEQKESMHNLLVFCQDVGASGTITIHGYQMYNDIADAFDTNWWGFGTSVEDEGTTSKISYYNVPGEWWALNAQYNISIEDPANTTTITFDFKGVEGHTYLFKIEGSGYSTEQSVEATGERQKFTLDFSNIAEEYRSKLDKIVFFCQTVGATGTVEMYSVTY